MKGVQEYGIVGAQALKIFRARTPGIGLNTTVTNAVMRLPLGTAVPKSVHEVRTQSRERQSGPVLP